MEYYHYKAEDFAADDYFKDWVNIPDALSDKFWKGFLNDYPEKYYEIMEARLLVESLPMLFTPDTADNEQPERIWADIQNHIEHPPSRISFISSIKAFGAAAAIVLAAGIAWFWFHNPELTGNETVSDIPNTVSEPEYYHAQPLTRTITLHDGSVVKLEGGSQLYYASNPDNQQREVQLTGKAYFQVRKNPGRPFIVRAGGLKTTVLGTSFTISAEENARNVTVEVLTGKVSVDTDKPADENQAPIILTPNQKIIYSKETQAFHKSLVEEPNPLPGKPTTSTIFIFEDAPVGKIFEAIESQYGIEIIYDSRLTEDCYLNINLNNENMYQKLNVISKALGIKYEETEGRIVFESKGCN